MFYTVYKVTNKVNNKEYIGFHKTKNPNDSYIGSGKIIKDAIKKYGKEAFEKTVIAIFDNKSDAEKFERELVNENYVLSTNNYNIALGGNVRAFPGENNPFYGKKHSDETISKIQEKSQNTMKQRGFVRSTKTIFWAERNCGTRFFSKKDMKQFYKDEGKKSCTDSVLIKRMFDDLSNLVFDLEYARDEIIKIHSNIIEHERKMRQKKALEVSKRFKGKPKDALHRERISSGNKGKPRPYVAEKVNRNPEKIEKTRLKHLGMKRSEESRKRMSEARKRMSEARKDFLSGR